MDLRAVSPPHVTCSVSLRGCGDGLFTSEEEEEQVVRQTKLFPPVLLVTRNLGGLDTEFATFATMAKYGNIAYITLILGTLFLFLCLKFTL